MGVDCFWEQSVWKMAVKGSSGPVQIFGNAGGFVNSELAAGRSPYEEMGQYRNVMMRLIKGTDNMWVAFPKAITVQVSDKIAFADMGNDVYVALVPHGATSTGKETYSKDGDYDKYTWKYSSSSVGALVLEAGTKEEHGSFDAFKTAISSKASFSIPSTGQVEYESTSGHKIKMQFMPPLQSYTYWHGAANQPAEQKTVSPAGVTPKVWVDGNYLDFSKWQSLRVTHGEKIVEQNWGSGALTATVGGKGMQIIVDPSTANVQYRKVDGLTQLCKAGTARIGVPRIAVHNGVLRLTRPLGGPALLEMFDPSGKCLARINVGAGRASVRLPQVGCGAWFCRLTRREVTGNVRYVKAGK
jgi:hypothetical protein